jgi:uncharacterized protein YrrD
LKLRNILNLPVFYEEQALIVGRVKRVLVNRSFQIAFLVVRSYQAGMQIIPAHQLILGKDTVIIDSLEALIPYIDEEQKTIYEEKMGNVIFDQEGRELGMVSDFVVDPATLSITALEVSAGIWRDIIDGRMILPLEQVSWSGKASAVFHGSQTGEQNILLPQKQREAEE